MSVFGNVYKLDKICLYLMMSLLVRCVCMYTDRNIITHFLICSQKRHCPLPVFVQLCCPCPQLLYELITKYRCRKTHLFCTQVTGLNQILMNNIEMNKTKKCQNYLMWCNLLHFFSEEGKGYYKGFKKLFYFLAPSALAAF